MAGTDLQNRLSKISKSSGAKTVRQQQVVREPSARNGKKPGPKSLWKDPQAHYVRLYTQLKEEDRNLLKSQVAGGVLRESFESVDHFINEAIIRYLKEFGIETSQESTVV